MQRRRGSPVRPEITDSIRKKVAEITAKSGGIRRPSKEGKHQTKPIPAARKLNADEIEPRKNIQEQPSTPFSTSRKKTEAVLGDESNDRSRLQRSPVKLTHGAFPLDLSTLEVNSNDSYAKTIRKDDAKELANKSERFRRLEQTRMRIMEKSKLAKNPNNFGSPRTRNYKDSMEGHNNQKIDISDMDTEVNPIPSTFSKDMNHLNSDHPRITDSRHEQDLKIRELQLIIDRQSKQISSMVSKQEYDELKQKFESSYSETDFNDLKTAHAAEIDGLKRQISKLETQSAESELLRENLAELEINLHEKSGELDRVREELNQERKNTAEKTDQLSAMESSLKQLRVQELEHDFQSKNEKLIQIKELAQSYNTQTQSALEYLEEISKIVKEKQSNLDNLVQQIDRSVDRRSKVLSRISMAAPKDTNIEEFLKLQDEISEENEALRAQNSRLLETIQQLEEYIQEMSELYADSERSKNDLEAKLLRKVSNQGGVKYISNDEELTEFINVMTEKVESLRAQLDEAREGNRISRDTH